MCRIENRESILGPSLLFKGPAIELISRTRSDTSQPLVTHGRIRRRVRKLKILPMRLGEVDEEILTFKHCSNVPSTDRRIGTVIDFKIQFSSIIFSMKYTVYFTVIHKTKLFYTVYSAVHWREEDARSERASALGEESQFWLLQIVIVVNNL